MPDLPDIRLALPVEAGEIARLSRDTIEHGLGWSWRTGRVLRAIRNPEANVAVLLRRDAMRGFGIMEYGDDAAHLVLLAVEPAYRHQGLGARLVAWLEASAQAAGIARFRLEARADNRAALAFYRQLGYQPAGSIAGYYEGSIDAIHLEKGPSR